MSVIGIDLGNRNSIIAVAQRGGIDIVLNECSNRHTPSMVGFVGQERSIGEAAMVQYARNIRNTVAQVKRLIGRKWNEKELQDELPLLPFKVKEIGDGKIGIEVSYNGEQVTFTPEEVTAMVLVQLKAISENYLRTKVKDVVISIPGFFTSAQRRALLDSTQIAGLNCLKLVNEITATAIAYGIYKTDLPESDPMHVMFVDIGDSHMSVGVVAFQKGKLRVLSTAYDRTLGGRNFDRALADHFAKVFQDKYKIDVKSNMKAWIRLETACEKVKKILSANSQAPLAIDSLMEDIDVSAMVTREDFEQFCAPLFERLQEPLKQVLAETGLSGSSLHAIELVGGASRMPQLAPIISKLTGKEFSRTMNAEESVARGAALQCAMLSPTFRVREFKVEDSNPYPINLVWKDLDSESMETEEPTEIFPKNCVVPAMKIITFPRGKPCEIKASYAPTADLPPGTSPFIGKWVIPTVPPTESGESAKVRVKVKLDGNGIFSVEYAQMIENVVASKEEDKKEAATAAAAQSPKEDDDKKAKEGDENKSAEKKEDAKITTKRTNLFIQEVTDGMPPAQIQALAAEEKQRLAKDTELRETAEARNAVEAYVYDTRSDLNGSLLPFVLEADKDAFYSQLNEAEDWLYGEGAQATKQAYQEKLAQLKKVGEPIRIRRREAEDRDDAIEKLRQAMENYRLLAQSTDPKYEHIPQEERQKVLNKVKEAEDSVLPKAEQQKTLPSTADPLIWVADITHTKENLDTFVSTIMNKPKPKPAAPAPKEEPKKEESAPKEETAEPTEKKEADMDVEQ
jgi:heat shock protein 4